ncbi:3-oxoacyl-ACP reductase FabG [Alphaproteobacteria bacterium]|jgi:3-oxoacyl-[acyl-carrier protein] reductase|nr:3-oxoacyl-ACP reductase FabG [Alphaproteobacteria bacterium]|tara:strand:+ start:572 stop:1396 length:825 start_codon:yes stop_codon:yes gene_type:complete
MDRLKNKVALITGGAKGLGASIAHHFFNEGAKIILCDINLDEALKTAKKLNGTAYYMDVSNSKNVQDVFIEIQSKFKQLDILVNNAGINGFEKRQDLLDERIKINNLQSKEFSETGKIESHFDVTVNMTDEEWMNMISVHLNGTFFCTREALKIMNDMNKGSIINMGSVLGTTGGPSSPHYSAAKAAILGFTRSTARELASRNIRVNAIAPGYIDTDMTSSLGDVKKLVKSGTPMKRFGDAEDISWAAVYLASEEAKFVTGQTLSPNGGFVMSQ